MFAGPIGTYFLTVDRVFGGMFWNFGCFLSITTPLNMDKKYSFVPGNSTFAAATAAIIANVVLVAYVVVAMREDQSEAIEAAEKEKESKKGI